MSATAPPQFKAKSSLLMPTDRRAAFNMTSDYSDPYYYTDMGAGADIGMFYDKMQWDKDRDQSDRYRKNMLLNKLWPEYENMQGQSRITTPAIPAPRYVNAGPVWSQGQIDAQAGLQRAALTSQATSQSAQFGRDLASRGFSPLSPFGMLNEQSNIMRANAGAAQNETQLNFNAAKANSDARLQAEQINANLYGDYARSLGSSRQQEMDYNSRQQQMQNQFLMGLMQSVM